MDVSILGKKILFICPKFFDYHSSIIETLTTLGADVYFFDERPSNSTFSKMFLRINKNLIKKKLMITILICLKKLIITSLTMF